jgi:hypothetical protein
VYDQLEEEFMNFIRRSIYISLPVGVLLSGCSPLENGRISETDCIHNFDVRQDGSVWEERLQKSGQGWTLKDIPVYQNGPGHAVPFVGNYPFHAVDFPKVVTNPQWVKHNPSALTQTPTPTPTPPEPKMLVVVLGQKPVQSASAGFTAGYIYYCIMDTNNKCGPWHSASDKPSLSLVTTPLLIPSLKVTTGLFGKATIAANDENGNPVSWSGTPASTDLYDFIWK